jgi:hypothetical protein
LRVFVEIRFTRDWPDVFRQAVEVTSRYPGQDELVVKLQAYPLAMEFPEKRTHYCTALVSELRQLRDVLRVEAERPPVNLPL